MSNEQSPKVRVLMMPDYRLDNPYQTLLSSALQNQNVKVEFPQGYRRILPITRALQDQAPIAILHLHWLSPYLKGGNWLMRFIYSIKFLIDILLVKLQGVGIVWTVHNAIAHDAQFPQLELWLNRQFAKFVDRIVVHYPSAVNEISQLYCFDPAKAIVILHGHYREVYGQAISRQLARQKLGLPDLNRIYLNLGMLKPYKGIEQLLTLWRDHPEISQDNTLLIAGKVMDQDYGNAIAQQVDTLDNVLLHKKFIQDDEIPLYFSAADIVVLPFQQILTSGSLLLAMSYGKPIIAPRLGSIPETLGTADILLYDAKHGAGLLDAIKAATVLDLQQLSQCVQSACDRLDWQAIGQTTSQLYESVHQNS